MNTMWDPWAYRAATGRTDSSDGVVGYEVHATDGHIGQVADMDGEVGAGSIVVDTGPWIFGRKVVLPAGTVERVDDAEQKVYVDLTKEQIRNSPELEEAALGDPLYREQIGHYYSGYYE